MFNVHFTVPENDITKFLWGRLEGIAPTTFWPWGRSLPSSRRYMPGGIKSFDFTAKEHLRVNQCVKIVRGV